MKFVLLVYQPSPFDPKSLPPEEHKEIGQHYQAVSAMPNVTPGLPLGLPKDAVTVRVKDGKTIATAEPYVDVAGAVGAYLILEAETKEEAVAVAARLPAAWLGGAIEVRPAEVYW
jgi:hypothetical protein